MPPIHVRAANLGPSAAAIVLTAAMAAGCTQPPAGDPARSLSMPPSPTPLAGNAVSGALAASGANTEAVCHARGNATFTLLRVNPSAVGGHLGHGDGRPLGPAPGGSFVLTSDCELVADVANVDGTWIGEWITSDWNASCGRDRNELRLTLHQSGSEVTGEVYWKLLESFFPPDEGLEQTLPLTSGSVSGNTFSFSFGPPEYGVAGSATVTGTAMTGVVIFAPSSCGPNPFEVIRQ